MHTTRRPRVLLLAIVTGLLAACAAPESPSAIPSVGGAPSADPPATTSPAASDPGTTAPETTEPSPSQAPASEAPADALLAAVLTDVRSGESFTLGEVAAAEGPVLLEPMAVWCSSCRAQQHEVKRAHDGGAGFSSVSLDVDLSETPEDLAAYTDREGFDWRFAMADPDLYRLLQERFGVNVTNPPLVPLIVIEPDGTVRALEFGRGVRSVEQLLAEIGAG